MAEERGKGRNSCLGGDGNGGDTGDEGKGKGKEGRIVERVKGNGMGRGRKGT